MCVAPRQVLRLLHHCYGSDCTVDRSSVVFNF